MTRVKLKIEPDGFAYYQELASVSAEEIAHEMAIRITLNAAILKEAYLSAERSITYYSADEISSLQWAGHLCYWFAKLKPLSRRPDISLPSALSDSLVGKKVSKSKRNPESENEDIAERKIDREIDLSRLNETVGLAIAHQVTLTGFRQFVEQSFKLDQLEDELVRNEAISIFDAHLSKSAPQLVESLRYHNYSSRSFVSMLETLFAPQFVNELERVIPAAFNQFQQGDFPYVEVEREFGEKQNLEKPIEGPRKNSDFVAPGNGSDKDTRATIDQLLVNEPVFGSEEEAFARQRTLDQLSLIEIVIPRLSAVHGGIGHNQPPLDGKAVEARDELVKSVSETVFQMKSELSKTEPDVLAVARSANRLETIRDWLSGKTETIAEEFAKGFGKSLGTAAGVGIVAIAFGLLGSIRGVVETTANWLQVIASGL